MRYMPKVLIHVQTPDGKKRDFLIRGNITVGEILGLSGCSSDTHTAYLGDVPVGPHRILSELGLTTSSVLVIQEAK